MNTTKLLERFLPATFHACLVYVFFVGCSWQSATGATTPPSVPTNALATQHFFCNAGYDRDQCGQEVAKLRAELMHYPAAAPGEWSWFIVQSEEWQPLALKLRLERRSPAFTIPEKRETFLEEALFTPQSIRSIELVRHFGLSSDQLLSFAVRHELGHAICHGGTEATANRIAEQLRNGKYPECGETVKSLTPLDELYLHGHLSGFPH
jgi:hypothetical protein